MHHLAQGFDRTHCLLFPEDKQQHLSVRDVTQSSLQALGQAGRRELSRQDLDLTPNFQKSKARALLSNIPFANTGPSVANRTLGQLLNPSASVSSFMMKKQLGSSSRPTVKAEIRKHECLAQWLAHTKY